MEDNKFDYKTLSLKQQYVWKLCKQILRDLKDGNCSDEEIEDLISKTEPRSRGYFREEDFVSSDEAMRILGLGQNRNRLFTILKAHNIQVHTFNGMKIGYRKEQIYKLVERFEKNKH